MMDMIGRLMFPSTYTVSNSCIRISYNFASLCNR